MLRLLNLAAGPVIIVRRALRAAVAEFAAYAEFVDQRWADALNDDPIGPWE